MVVNLVANRIDPAQIAFGERDDGMLRSKISQNLKVFLGLRHPAVVGSDRKQRQIDRAHAGDHVAHKIFVTGHVHNAGVNPLAVWRSEIQFGEPEVNGDLPFLFFGQSIRVCSRQRFDQRAFAVIDVPGSANDEMTNAHVATAAARMA